MGIEPPSRPERSADSRVRSLRRGPSVRTIQTRRSADAYELLVTIDGATHVEPFSSLPRMLARQRALVSNWRAHGWNDTAE